MLKEINQYIQLWEHRCYSEGLPDAIPNEIDDLAPSYKRIAISILKNDLSYIGIVAQESKYYGILKAIELNKPYKKRKTMTQQETREFIFKLIDTLIAKNCYIKGYGNLFRICDQNHNPVINITRAHMDILKLNNIVLLNGLIYNLNVLANPFSHPVGIKLIDKL